jgi:F420-dependent oxidoreductase-like protein
MEESTMFGAQLVNEQATWEEIRAVLDVMERGRWSSVYAYDHFIPPWHRTNEVMEHELLPTLEGWSLIAAAAAVTKRLELGVLVSGNTYRNPALLAKMAATVDVVSGGRVVLGIGAGWNVREHEAYGWDFPPLRERSDRLEEACALIRRLFHDDARVDFEGRYYRLKQAAFAPRRGGARPIPIMVGGTGERRTMRTLARYGDIMNVIASPERVRHLNEVLARHCEEIDRDPAQIKRTVHVPIRIEHDEVKAKKLRGENDWAMIGAPTYVIDRIADFLAVGITEFIPQIRPQRPEVYEALDREVFAAFDGVRD